jgi:hypoxanthine phosphoribosyltransferase
VKRRPAPVTAGKPSRALRGRKLKAVRPSRRAEQPLGEGVGDAFALMRLNVPQQHGLAGREVGVREVGWSQFGELARDLAERIGREFQPDVILGVVNGGVFLGGALAVPLRAEFHSVQVEKQGKRSVAERLSSLAGKSVLVVDDVTVSGKTLAAACAAAHKAGAKETRTATLVVRPGGNHADFFALETRDLVVFGWDYQLHGGASGSNDPGEVGV